MADDAATTQYDAFLSYDHADAEWVESWLLPRLRDTGLRITTPSDFVIGVPRLINIERLTDASRHTLLVLSPAWLASEWSAFDGLLTQSSDPSALQRRLLPLLRAPGTLPRRLAMLTPADFSDPTRWDDELARLVRNLGGDVARPRRAAGELPLDWIPDVAPLPPGSRMPLARNPLFVGRDDDLRAIAAALRGGGTAAIGQIAAATGLGGIGKTNLATEFVHRYGQYFPGGVFWLSFADPNNVHAEVAACGGAGSMDLPRFSTLTPDDQVARVRQEWQRAVPRLLVFDNCEDEPLLAQWRPTTGGAHALVTARRTSWDPTLGVQSLPLGVLPRADSVALLHKFCPDLPADDPQLAAIATELGDLPLALHLAGSFLKRYGADISPAEYLDELHAASLLAHESLQDIDATLSPTNHILHVGRSFALSYAKLQAADATDALALALLARAACFAPGEPIPRDLLLATVALPDKPAQRRATRALTRLVDLGLLEVGTDAAVKLHRLLVTFVRAESVDVEAQTAAEQALIDAGYVLLAKRVPAPLSAIQAHLRHVTDAASSRDDARASNLCTVMCRYLGMVGKYAAAQPYAARVLAIDEGRAHPHNQTVATHLSDLAELLEAQGDYAAARSLYERALAITEQVLGPEHPDTATCLNNLANLLRYQAEYPMARPLYERALAIRKHVLGPEHPDTATSLNNLATLLQYQGEHSAARPLYERALAIRERVLGPDHPKTATSLNNLADLLYSQREYAAARPLYERALAIRERVLGPEHPDTAMILTNLANLLRTQREYMAARPLYERALAIRERVLGPDHAKTAASLNNLADLLHAQRDDMAARPLYERALTICVARLGADHPTTDTIRRKLAALDRSHPTRG